MKNGRKLMAKKPAKPPFQGFVCPKCGSNLKVLGAFVPSGFFCPKCDREKSDAA